MMAILGTVLLFAVAVMEVLLDPASDLRSANLAAGRRLHEDVVRRDADQDNLLCLWRVLCVEYCNESDLTQQEREARNDAFGGN